ncbi:hypothetical protein [Streptomyces parvulus]|uniref:hypothetical protein n=1 Tax=Streptomyces parvulus TaxID=146923 RepID=UPI0036AC7E0B
MWDAEGDLVGCFVEKDVAFLVRSAWVLDQPGFPSAVDREPDRFAAVLRRVRDFLPLGLGAFLWPYQVCVNGVATQGQCCSVDKRHDPDHHLMPRQ